MEEKAEKAKKAHCEYDTRGSGGVITGNRESIHTQHIGRSGWLHDAAYLLAFGDWEISIVERDYVEQKK